MLKTPLKWGQTISCINLYLLKKLSPWNHAPLNDCAHLFSLHRNGIDCANKRNSLLSADEPYH